MISILKEYESFMLGEVNVQAGYITTIKIITNTFIRWCISLARI